MFISHVNCGITYRLSLNDKIAVIRSDDNFAKTYFLKSLLDAQFAGRQYCYYNWSNYKKINWLSGVMYNKFNVITLDDADLYIHSIIQYIPYIKASLIIVCNQTNASNILRADYRARLYKITLDNATYTLSPKPAICAYCGQEFPAKLLTTEHIIPRSFCNRYIYGTPILEHHWNKVYTCFECNRRKSDDILIPKYNKSGWMRYMTPEQIGGYSDIFVDLLLTKSNEVMDWIFVKNMQSHTNVKLDYIKCREAIEEDVKFFLTRYTERKPGEYWKLI